MTLVVKSFSVFFASLIVTLLFITIVCAHVPLSAEDNGNISSAMYISEPAKSWAIYGVLEEQAAQYYSFDLEEGEMIHLSLLKSTDPREKDFQPEIALLFSGVKVVGQKTENVTPFFIPKGYRVLDVEGIETTKPTYEPFGPSSYIDLVTVNLSVPESTRYYAAVYSKDIPGHYALAVGNKEVFSFSERITMPIRILSVYLWEGQSLSMLLIPYLAAEIIAILIFWRKSRRTIYCLSGTLAGFLFLATSASVVTQGVYNLTRVPFGNEVYVTLAIAVFHAFLGVSSIRLAGGNAGIMQRTLLAVMGTIALLAGSGMIIGPIFAIASSVSPSKKDQALREVIE
jgi:hypothetical protein